MERDVLEVGVRAGGVVVADEQRLEAGVTRLGRTFDDPRRALADVAGVVRRAERDTDAHADTVPAEERRPALTTHARSKAETGIGPSPL